MSTTFTIAGMSCGHCVAAVRRALETVDEIHVDAVEVGRAEVSSDDARSFEKAALAIEQAGYTVIGTS